jgi:hypothetical protein
MTEVNRINSSLRDLAGRSLFLHWAAIEVALGRSATGQRLASSGRPLRRPLSRRAILVRMGAALAKSVRDDARSSRSHLTTSVLGDPQCRCARESDALFSRKSCPNSLSVSALAAASLPLAGRRCAEVAARRKRGHGGDNVELQRCPFPDTLRCPRPFTIQPTKLALLRARSGSAFGSRYRGGATPPPLGNVDPSAVDVCPLRGRRSPLVLIASDSEAVRRLKLHHRNSVDQMVTSLAPTVDRTGVLSGVQVSRASRAAQQSNKRDLDTASARPVNGNCRSEPEPRT